MTEADHNAEVIVALNAADDYELEAGTRGLDQPEVQALRRLNIGSDVEIAQRVAQDLLKEFGDVVFSEGDFYIYDGRCWKPLNESTKRLRVHVYDGATFTKPNDIEDSVRLNKNRVNSVLFEMRAILNADNFFKDAPPGINCANGFIEFDQTGLPRLVPHSSEHRCRHVLPGHWCPDIDAENLPSESLTHKLVHGVFKDDADADQKRKLLAELAGCTALGYATKLPQPKAAVLIGEKAENGKSEVIDAIRGLVPESAISSISAGKLGDERFIVHLAGKLLNATDELSSSTAIASDAFKKCVTGNMVSGRDVYSSAKEFRPTAQHIFACNVLPAFPDGMDRGVIRRLLMLEFCRVIPMDERVEEIGKRIAKEEPDLLLSFAVSGATRLIKQKNFTIPPSSDRSLKKWVYGSDPVLAWVATRVDPPGPMPPGQRAVGIKSAYAYGMFRDWALAEGFRQADLPNVSGFCQRLTANKKVPGVAVKHRNSGNWLVGLKILGGDRDPKNDDESEG